MSIENIIAGFGKKIINGASALYHSTMFKIGSLFLAGSIIEGCSKPQFFEGYWPPDQAQVELGSDAEGFKGGAGVKFEGDNSSTEVVLRGQKKEYGIESSGNNVEESSFNADVNVQKGNVTVNQVIETSETTTKMPDGTVESDVGSFHAATDIIIKKQDFFGGSPNHILFRPYLRKTSDDTIVGPIDSSRWGFYCDAKYGMFLPLLSFDQEEVEGIDAKEFQIGLGFEGKWPGKDIMGIIGLYGAFAEVDGEKDNRMVAVGDANIVPAFNVNADHDGNLTNVRVYGCVGGNGNAQDKFKAMRNYVKQLYLSEVLERGLPESTIAVRKTNARQSMEEGLDAKLFYLAGYKEAVDSDGNIKPEFAGLVAFRIPLSKTDSEKRMFLGATYGSVLENYTQDAVDQRYGMIVGAYVGRVRIDGSLERVDYVNLKPENLLQVRAIFPLR